MADIKENGWKPLGEDVLQLLTGVEVNHFRVQNIAKQ